MVVLLAAALAPEALSRPQGSSVPGASEAVGAFYRYHFSHGFCYTGACLNRRRRWLTLELYELLRYEQRRKLPPDTVPYIDGDPFTDSQETPHSFRVGKSERQAGGAKAEVQVYWREKGKVVDQRTYSILLLKEGGTWKVADIINHTGTSLRDGLRELKRQDGQTQ